MERRDDLCLADFLPGGLGVGPLCLEHQHDSVSEATVRRLYEILLWQMRTASCRLEEYRQLVLAGRHTFNKGGHFKFGLKSWTKKSEITVTGVIQEEIRANAVLVWDMLAANKAERPAEAWAYTVVIRFHHPLLEAAARLGLQLQAAGVVIAGTFTQELVGGHFEAILTGGVDIDVERLLGRELAYQRGRSCDLQALWQYERPFQTIIAASV